MPSKTGWPRRGPTRWIAHLLFRCGSSLRIRTPSPDRHGRYRSQVLFERQVNHSHKHVCDAFCRRRTRHRKHLAQANKKSRAEVSQKQCLGAVSRRGAWGSLREGDRGIAGGHRPDSGGGLDKVAFSSCKSASQTVAPEVAAQRNPCQIVALHRNNILIFSQGVRSNRKFYFGKL